MLWKDNSQQPQKRRPVSFALFLWIAMLQVYVVDAWNNGNGCGSVPQQFIRLRPQPLNIMHVKNDCHHSLRVVRSCAIKSTTKSAAASSPLITATHTAHPPPPHYRGSSSSTKQQQQQQQQQQQVKPRPRQQRFVYSPVSTPDRVEQQMTRALESLRASIHIRTQQQLIMKRTTLDDGANDNDDTDPSTNSTTEESVVVVSFLFPTTRECNSALAAMGDAGELLRALRLFGKMRKAAALLEANRHLGCHHSHNLHLQSQPPPQDNFFPPPRIPIPTLVTYSTLMSRANSLGKPRVALRLWRLMLDASSSSSSSSSSTTTTTSTTRFIPDTRAVNILLNAYAKLADLKSARNILEQMKTGSGPDVFVPLIPNLVTFNTVLDACLKAGDLDAALQTKMDLDTYATATTTTTSATTTTNATARGSIIRPDARTYTTLIATVARKTSRAAGQHDPSLAFALLQEMHHHHHHDDHHHRGGDIAPNGHTYSALIDAAGRCQRSDLALQGLRLMLLQRRNHINHNKTNHTHSHSHSHSHSPPPLENEVGAWTAAINACGKARRLDTALRLFHAMPNFGVYPNAVTCGCLMDALLRSVGGKGERGGGNDRSRTRTRSRTADALTVLRYMKTHQIVPTEVMYTSLMTRAEGLARFEKKQQQHLFDDYDSNSRPSLNNNNNNNNNKNGVRSRIGNETETKAIEVYTELMTSLTESNFRIDASSGKIRPKIMDANTLLLKVFLVFQQMKTVGTDPDLACFNALLRACARAGDLARAKQVFQQILNCGLHPNDTTWQQMLRAASKCRRSDIAIDIWKEGLRYPHRHRHRGRRTSFNHDESRVSWRPSESSFGVLLVAHLQEAASTRTVDDKKLLFGNILTLYEGLLLGDDKLGFDRIHPNLVLDSQRTMMLILQAIVALHDLCLHDNGHWKQDSLVSMACSILQLESFNVVSLSKHHWASANAYRVALAWKNNRP